MLLLLVHYNAVASILSLLCASTLLALPLGVADVCTAL
jgi:hypothetical protein